MTSRTNRHQRKVFLSHSAPNSDPVLPRLREFLLKRFVGSLEVFYSHESILPGQKWLAVLDAELRECDLMLCFLSEAAAGSKWVALETGYASARRCPIVAVGIQGYDATQLTGPTSFYQAMNLRTTADLGMLCGVINRVFGLTASTKKMCAKEFNQIMDPWLVPWHRLVRLITVSFPLCPERLEGLKQEMNFVPIAKPTGAFRSGSIKFWPEPGAAEQPILILEASAEVHRIGEIMNRISASGGSEAHVSLSDGCRLETPSRCRPQIESHFVAQSSGWYAQVRPGKRFENYVFRINSSGPQMRASLQIKTQQSEVIHCAQHLIETLMGAGLLEFAIQSRQTSAL